MGRCWKAVLALSEVIIRSVLIDSAPDIFKSAVSKKTKICCFKIHLNIVNLCSL